MNRSTIIIASVIISALCGTFLAILWPQIQELQRPPQHYTATLLPTPAATAPPAIKPPVASPQPVPVVEQSESSQSPPVMQPDDTSAPQAPSPAKDDLQPLEWELIGGGFTLACFTGFLRDEIHGYDPSEPRGFVESLDHFPAAVLGASIDGVTARTAIENLFQPFVYIPETERFLFEADFQGDACMVVTGLVSPSVYNTLRSTIKERAAKTIQMQALPSLQRLAHIASSTSHRRLGVVVYYGARNFADEHETAKPEAVCLLSMRADIDALNESLITMEELLRRSIVLITSMDAGGGFTRTEITID